MPSRISGITMAALLLIAAGCGGGDGDRIDPEDAGVGPEPGFDVLIDTAATPPGGVPGVTPSGDVTAPGPPPRGDTTAAGDTAGTRRNTRGGYR